MKPVGGATTPILMPLRSRIPIVVELVPALPLIALWIKLVAAPILLNPIWFPEDRYADIATLAVLLLLTWPLPLLPRPVRYVCAVVLNLVLSVLLLADILHFRVFNEFLSIPDVQRAPQLRASWRAAFVAWRAWDLLLAIDLVIAIACIPLYRAVARAAPAPRAALRRGVSIAMVVLGCSFAAPVLRAMQVDREAVYTYNDARQVVVRGIGILPYHLYDAFIQLAFALRGRLVTSAAEREHAVQYLATFRAQQPPPSDLFGVARGKNLIVVMAESLQAFPVSVTIDGRPVAPRLAQFAAESLAFAEFFDQTNLGTTSDGEFTSMQSLHPLTSSAVATRYPLNAFHGLPGVLVEHGYRTVSAVGEPGHQWNMLQMHPNLGFQRSFFKPSFHFDFEVGPGVPDHFFFPQAAALLREQRRPFMSFFLSLSNHAPYDMPAALNPLPVGALEGTLLGKYLQTVNYFDRAFGMFVDALRANGMLDDSVVAVYGDHHGFLDDQQAVARLVGIEDEDRRRQWLAQKRLPFFVRLPHARAAGVHRGAGGHLDVAPTLLSLLGIPPDEMVSLGRDLLRDANHLIVFRDGSFIDEEHQYLRAPGPAEASVCYDARSGERVSPEIAADKRRAAEERLAISDLIIRANLIPYLTERSPDVRP